MAEDGSKGESRKFSVTFKISESKVGKRVQTSTEATCHEWRNSKEMVR